MLYATTVGGIGHGPPNHLMLMGVMPVGGAGTTAMYNRIFSARFRHRQRGSARAFTGNVKLSTDKNIPWPWKSVVVLSVGIPILLMAPMRPAGR